MKSTPSKGDYWPIIWVLIMLLVTLFPEQIADLVLGR